MTGIDNGCHATIMAPMTTTERHPIALPDIGTTWEPNASDTPCAEIIGVGTTWRVHLTIIGGNDPYAYVVTAISGPGTSTHRGGTVVLTVRGGDASGYARALTFAGAAAVAETAREMAE